MFFFGKPGVFGAEVGHRYVTQYQLRVRMKGETLKVEIRKKTVTFLLKKSVKKRRNIFKNNKTNGFLVEDLEIKM